MCLLRLPCPAPLVSSQVVFFSVGGAAAVAFSPAAAGSVQTVETASTAKQVRSEHRPSCHAVCFICVCVCQRLWRPGGRCPDIFAAARCVSPEGNRAEHGPKNLTCLTCGPRLAQHWMSDFVGRGAEPNAARPLLWRPQVAHAAAAGGLVVSCPARSV